MSAQAPTVLDLSKTYGGLLSGCYLSQAVWGISTLQVFFYFQNFEQDKATLKLLVIGLWLLDTANQILVLKGTYEPLIVHYGDFAGLAANRIEIVIHTWLEAIVTFVVQMYFIRRIFKFGRKQRWMIPFCAVLSGLASWQLIGTIIYWIWAYGKPTAEQGKPRSVAVNISLRAAAVVVDIVVSLGMVFLLTRRREQMLSNTRKMVFRILIVTINSGTWTALVALCVLILVKTYPGTLIYCILEFSLNSLYFSTFMANLNARSYVWGDGTVVSSVFISDTTNKIVLGPVGGASRGNASATLGSRSAVAKNHEVYIEPEYTESFAASKPDV